MWPSPVTTELVVAASVGLGGPQVVGDRVWWAESRPHEGGRVQLVHRAASGDAQATEVLPDGFSARSRAHEYGGGAWWATPSTVVFTNAADQRLWRLALDDHQMPVGDPVAVTPEPHRPGADRHADLRPLGGTGWWVAVRERHGDGRHPVDELVAVRVDGAVAEPVVLASQSDFVSNPRVSPDGAWLCWLAWDLPAMPWQGTTLWVAGLDVTDATVRLVDPVAVAGGPDESLAQPGWLPDGRLAVVSDDDNWWNLWTFASPGCPVPGTATQRTVVAGELAPPAWVFGQSTWTVADDGTIVGVWRADGHDHIGVVPAGSDEVHWVHSGHLSCDAVAADGNTVALIAASFATEPEVTAIAVDELAAAATAGVHAAMTVRRAPRDLGLDGRWWSLPEAITVPTTDGRRTHAQFFAPTNPDVGADTGSGGGLPPLLVLVHGGPTAAARPQLQLAIQFWTSRGFAVADVNYRGSVGFGRRYRNALRGQWGVADVDDCVAVARWLADNGRVDPDRWVIRGSSAGGYTALRAVTTTDVFAAAVSLYGIADLELLEADSHKFEKGYNSWLIGELPDHADRYVDRSPIHHLDRLNSALLVLQGSEDTVVPPAQAELLVGAARRHGVPVGYVLFDGEGHGFRSADTLRRALDAEAYFLARVLGLAATLDGEPPVVIDNLDATGG